LRENEFGNTCEGISPWWVQHKWLRRLNYLALRMVDQSYIKWTKSKISHNQFRKIIEKFNKEFPPSKFSLKNVIGREKEIQTLLNAFRVHVLFHTKSIINDLQEVPKAICLIGESGTGKTFLALSTIREMLSEASKNGLMVSPIIIKASDVYSEFYGRSTKQLSKILQKAIECPSIVYIDEFQSFGRKVKGETGAEVEDTRVQDEFNRWLDEILNNKTRTLLIVATNAYESIREDMRRRLTTIDLNSGVTHEMLLAIIKDCLNKEKWLHIKPEEILSILEKEITKKRESSLTPNDIHAVFKEIKRIKLNSSQKFDVSLNDFQVAAKSLKLYSKEEEPREIMNAVYLMKPNCTRDDIGGLHDIKHEILNNISLAFNKKAKELGYESNFRFLLLGPPGTGKTLIASVAAAENNVNFLKVRGSEFISGANFVGEPEKRVKELFRLARQKSPCILFLDEADAIFWGVDSIGNKILAQIKAELSELTPEDQIVVIAASNKEELIDQATRDRFEPHVYYIHPPMNELEWNEVVQVHLRKYDEFLHPEVEPSIITKFLKKQRIVSPRVVAEIIADAHRLWISELCAILEMLQAIESKNMDRVEKVKIKYKKEIERFNSLLKEYSKEGIELKLDEAILRNYKMRLFHFKKAIENLENSEERFAREINEALIFPKPLPGVSYALYASRIGTGGVLTIQCSTRPIIPGEPIVSVTGHSNSTIVGQAVIPDESVKQSAENAVEALRSWLWNRIGLDLGRFHVHFQIRSILEGVPGQGVSGSSAGFAMFIALISELIKIPISSSKVVTGTIGVKLDIGPVGGVGGRGSNSGKIIGILKTKKVHISDLLIPKINYEYAYDEIRLLEEEGIKVHKITNALESFKILFNMDEADVLRRINQFIDKNSLKA
jgi:SpoVK/Ycf46/Vps4 family AAA+-type ATPase